MLAGEKESARALLCDQVWQRAFMGIINLDHSEGRSMQSGPSLLRFRCTWRSVFMPDWSSKLYLLVKAKSSCLSRHIFNPATFAFRILIQILEKNSSAINLSCICIDFYENKSRKGIRNQLITFLIFFQTWGLNSFKDVTYRFTSCMVTRHKTTLLSWRIILLFMNWTTVYIRQGPMFSLTTSRYATKFGY